MATKRKKDNPPRSLASADKVIIVTKIKVPVGETSFPEKMKKANDMLSKTKRLDEK